MPRFDGLLNNLRLYFINKKKINNHDLVALDDDEQDDEWNRLMRKIEEGLMPAEERVAQKLKDHIADADTPSALVAEFGRYSELMKREGLKRALRGERELLLTAYYDLIGRAHS